MPAPKKTLALTPANISGTLTRANFKKSKYEASKAVRGWGSVSAGFKVEARTIAGRGSVLCVFHVRGSMGHCRGADRDAEMAAKYAEALDPKFKVEIIPVGNFVIVSQKPEEGATEA